MNLQNLLGSLGKNEVWTVEPGLILKKKVQISWGRGHLEGQVARPGFCQGWVVMPAVAGDPPGPGGLPDCFQQAGFGTLELDLPVLKAPRRPAFLKGIFEAGAQFRAAASWLQKEWAQPDQSISYFGRGLETVIILRAAGHEPPGAVISLNGYPELAWRALKCLRSPILLLVDEKASGLRGWCNRFASKRFRNKAELILVPGKASLQRATLQKWFFKDLKDKLTAMTPEEEGLSDSPFLKQRLALGTLLLALSLAYPEPEGLTAGSLERDPVSAVSSTPSREQEKKSGPGFVEGKAYQAENIRGDGFQPIKNRFGKKSAHRKRGQNDQAQVQRFFPDGSVKVKEKQISGDGFRIGDLMSLTDAQGVRWLVNTNVTFTTASSASGAIYEASFTRPVTATTSRGAAIQATLSDALDGYGGLVVNGISYNMNGPLTRRECQGPVSGVERQLVFPVQRFGNIEVYRKVFIPDNDSFARHLEVVKNLGPAAEEVVLKTSNNLGSDADTLIFGTSDGDEIAEVTDHWIATMENYVNGTSPDPRLAHIVSGPGGKIGVSQLSFANGNDTPFWEYSFDLNPGQSAIVMHFITAQATKAAAIAKARELASGSGNGLQCLTPGEIRLIINFPQRLYLPIILKN